MQKNITLKVLPHEAADPLILQPLLANALQISSSTITGYNIIKQSIDARGRQVWYQLAVQVYIDEPYQQTPIEDLLLKDVHQASRTVLIIGAGPAGLFAALRLIHHGIKPIILERGKNVRARRRDLAAINKEGVVNPESNYCFGEGGAGTYSDGKLYTRSTKRGNVGRILSSLVHFGADRKILYDAHPHIGTNKLPHIITAIREQIIACGGEVLFEKKLSSITQEKNKIHTIQTSDGQNFPAEAVILATGHSARDIFELLHDHQIHIEAKPFALGVRVEHPQALIDSIQYHCPSRGEFLPPASYSLVQQVEGRGVFSFCMCPGGIIAPAATSPGEIVVNGWSPSKRNNPFANSGMVVSVEEKNWKSFDRHGPLAAMYFQQSVEQKAFTAGGGSLKAPAQRLVDFTENKLSSSLPDNSYLPGLHSSHLSEVLPAFVHQSLQQAFKEFGKKMKGYFTNEAVVVATESRTSSPVRIPRDTEGLFHPQLHNLYPCGEGAGYAGGIVSAAMDGERIADCIAVNPH
ncbi:MAG: NAD(P)/FAD-dependent oxidoreductase [Flavisolibacter sp.]